MTSSGSVSTDITWPTSHRAGQQLLRDATKRTYVAQSNPRQSRKVYDLLPSAILSNGNLLGSVTQGEKEMMEGGGRMVGRLDDRYAFERG
jgi:hypothetical protein